MAVDPAGVRQEGVSPLTIIHGSQGSGDAGSAVGDVVNLPTVSNGGGEAGPRDVNANSSLSSPSTIGGIEVDCVTAVEVPVNVSLSPPVANPDSSGKYAIGDSNDVWGGVDSTARNSRALDIPETGFAALGETPQGDCD